MKPKKGDVIKRVDGTLAIITSYEDGMVSYECNCYFTKATLSSSIGLHTATVNVGRLRPASLGELLGGAGWHWATVI